MLQYPPYMIALTALHMAVCQLETLTLKVDMTKWFAELSVDLRQILQISKDILELYRVWGSYKEDQSLQMILNMGPKAKPCHDSSTQPTNPSSNSQQPISWYIQNEKIFKSKFENKTLNLYQNRYFDKYQNFELFQKWSFWILDFFAPSLSLLEPNDPKLMLSWPLTFRMLWVALFFMMIFPVYRLFKIFLYERCLPLNR